VYQKLHYSSIKRMRFFRIVEQEYMLIGNDGQNEIRYQIPSNMHEKSTANSFIFPT
jgi:hypothetical protein